MIDNEKRVSVVPELPQCVFVTHLFCQPLRLSSLLFLSGLFSFAFGFAGMMMFDGQSVTQLGMFQGYNTAACAVVVLQVCSL